VRLGRTLVVDVTELADGLWRWTALHPGWTPEEGGLDGWEQEVSSLYLEAPDAVVLIDPLVPGDERDRFFDALDRDVEHASRPVAIVVTLDDHERDAVELRERYDAETWAPAAEATKMRAPVTRPFAAGERVVGGIETFGTGRGGEVVLWIPEHRTLFTGDAILGSPEGLRRCPDSWLPEGLAPEELKARLSPLARLPVAIVVPAHGEPVTEDAAEVLRAALEA
jgi:glyoxylase-like metal-dependent hydrolase (beta-lactamase superfamily II)